MKPEPCAFAADLSDNVSREVFDTFSDDGDALEAFVSLIEELELICDGLRYDIANK